MKKILLLGTGYTLERVASKLVPGSFIATSRQEEKLREFRRRGWSAERLDLSGSSDLAQIFLQYPDIELIVDSIPPAKDSNSSEYQQKILEALQKLRRIERIIYLSTTGVFGVTDGSWINEETECNPQTPNGKARYEVEQLYISSGYPTTILRLPAIYGQGRGIEVSLAKGSYKLIENGERYTNRIHVEDLSTIIVRALSVENLPKILCVSDDYPATARDVAEYYCSKLNLPFPESISFEEAKMAGLYTMLGNQKVSNKLMKEILNLKLRYPSYRSS